eukprot:2994594-Prymnesium_polylepis.1
MCTPRSRRSCAPPPPSREIQPAKPLWACLPRLGASSALSNPRPFLHPVGTCPFPRRLPFDTAAAL